MRRTRKGWHVVRHMMPNTVMKYLIGWRFEPKLQRMEVMQALSGPRPGEIFGLVNERSAPRYDL